MVTVGYARVSSIGQNLDLQLRKLREYGCDEIFQEKRSGRTAVRPELNECLRYVRSGDVLVITRLDRLARSTLDLHRILEELQKNKVGFVVLDQSIDTISSAGKLVIGILASVADYSMETCHPFHAEGCHLIHGKVATLDHGVSHPRQSEAKRRNVHWAEGIPLSLSS